MLSERMVQPTPSHTELGRVPLAMFYPQALFLSSHGKLNIYSPRYSASYSWLDTYHSRIGEKFLDWVDEPLSPEAILESVSLYWFTNTFPRGIYFYREVSIPSLPSD